MAPLARGRGGPSWNRLTQPGPLAGYGHLSLAKLARTVTPGAAGASCQCRHGHPVPPGPGPSSFRCGGHRRCGRPSGRWR